MAPSTSDDLVTWLLGRLTGPTANEEWRGLVESVWGAIGGLPLRQLLPPDRVTALVEVHLDPDRLAELVRPMARAGLRDLVEQLRTYDEPTGRWVPPEAKAILDAIVERPGLVDESWVRTVLSEKAVEDILSDTLYRALRDFSTIIPRLIVRALPTGRFAKLGGAASLGQRIGDEIEKLIEPEIKRFTSSGSARALERAADFAVERVDAPASVELRRHVVEFILAKPPSFHVYPLDDALLEDLDQIAEHIARHAASAPQTRTRVEATIQRIADAHGDRTVDQITKDLGLTLAPPFDALAEATWPIVEQVLGTSPVRTWLAGVVEELLEQAAEQGAGEAS